MLKNYLVTSFRNLTRNKATTLINVAGLGISIACCIVIYVLVRHEYTFDTHHRKVNQIYRIVYDERNAEGLEHNGIVPFVMADALRNDFPQLEGVTQVYNGHDAIVKIPGTGGATRLFEESEELTYADAQYLKTFDFTLLAGKREGILSNPDEVVLTRRLADKYFGPEIGGDYNRLMGRMLTVNKQTYRISAVLEDVPRNTNVTFRLLLPFLAFEKQNSHWIRDWNNLVSGSYIFVTLPEGYAPARLEKELVFFTRKYFNAETAARRTYRLQPLKDIHTNETYGGTSYVSPSVLIIAFVTMGIIVLLTACINFINLATAQSVKRAKEIGIRKTLGGLQWQLVLQFMGETFLLVMLASGLAVYLAEQFLQAFNQYLSIVIDLGLHIDSSVIFFLIALGVFITLLAGYYPARVMANFQPIQALKQTLTTKNTGFANRFSLRKALVVTQFAISQLLIIGTIVVALQMRYFRSRDVGYAKSGILTIPVPENNAEKLALFRNQLLTQPGVTSVSFSSGPPTSQSNSFGEFRRRTAGASEKYGIEKKFVDPAYLPTYQIRLLAGRNLRDADKITLGDSADRINVVVNRKAIGILGFREPAQALGQSFWLDGDDEGVIVGVVEDFANVPLQQEINPCLLYYATNWVNMASIKMNTPPTTATLSFVKSSWESLFPDHVFKAQDLDEYFRYAAFYILEDIMYQSFKIFSLLAILIGCMGLYGLVAYLALQRQKEIGIRKVLGASTGNIMLLFSKEFTILIVIAFAIAAPLGYMAMSVWLEAFAHRIDLQAAYFLAAFLASLTIAALTVGYRAVKAALANPVHSLRTE